MNYYVVLYSDSENYELYSEEPYTPYESCILLCFIEKNDCDKLYISEVLGQDQPSNSMDIDDIMSIIEDL